MRRVIAVALAVLLTAMPGTAFAQTNPGWLVGKWTMDGDCTRRDAVNFTMAADGSLVLMGIDGGRWWIDGSKLTLELEGERETFTIAKVSNDRFNADGTVVARCGPPPAPLTESWLTGTRWSGHANCAVVFTFNRGGKLTVSNGTKGTWSISGGRILMAVGGDKPMMLERRSERELIEVESRGGFTRC